MILCFDHVIITIRHGVLSYSLKVATAPLSLRGPGPFWIKFLMRYY